MKTLFVSANLVCVILSAYFSVQLFYKNVLPAPSDTAGQSPTQVETASREPAEAGRSSISQYDLILKRNLFNVQLAEAPKPVKPAGNAPPQKEEPKPTPLKLVLWGTVTGVSQVYAVIEDKKTRKQSLYQVGDPIQGATIKEILNHQVLLHYQEEDQVLEMTSETGRGPGPSPPMPMRVPPPGNALRNAVLEPAGTPRFESLPGQMNTELLKKQVRFRPYFQNGIPDGVMVYGIRANSFLAKMGIRNGDIIKDINGVPVTSAGDEMLLFSEMEQGGDGILRLLRRGEQKELSFNFSNLNN